MSARFAELMALSAAQTQDAVAATQQILEEKRRKEEQRKKEQLQKEKRERELEVRRIKKKLEEEREAEERKRKREEERRRREELVRQKEEEQRKNLIYGKGRSNGSSGGSGRGRKANNDSDDEDESGGPVLTREEKRQRKLFADLNKSFTSSRKGHSSPSSQGLRKTNRALVVADFSVVRSARPHEPRHTQQTGGGNSSDSADNLLSVRKQLASTPAPLMRLGTNKRDMRTIDEIVTDLHKKKEGKIIDGDEARRNGFDWFGEQKKLKQKATSLPSLSPTPEPRASQSPRAHSKERTLGSKASSSALPRAGAVTPQAPERKEPRTRVTLIKPESVGSLSFSKVGKINDSSVGKPATSSAKLGATLQPPRNSLSNGKSSSSLKKRARSGSLSDSDVSLDGSPPPSKRRSVASSGRNDISSEIWKLFGKDRSRYVRNDVYSDEDDDMEADADALRREELRSERIAKKEDELAAEEERRHEEEKRRKKKEKERRGY